MTRMPGGLEHWQARARAAPVTTGSGQEPATDIKSLHRRQVDRACLMMASARHLAAQLGPGRRRLDTRATRRLSRGRGSGDGAGAAATGVLDGGESAPPGGSAEGTRRQRQRLDDGECAPHGGTGGAGTAATGSLERAPHGGTVGQWRRRRVRSSARRSAARVGRRRVRSSARHPAAWPRPGRRRK